MKNYSVLILVLSFVILAFGCCKKDEEITCKLSTNGKAPVDMRITFTATKTGDGIIELLAYKTSAGVIGLITAPSLPWTLNVDATEGTDVSITAQGTVKDGSLTVSFHGEDQGNTVEGSDFCSQTND